MEILKLPERLERSREEKTYKASGHWRKETMGRDVSSLLLGNRKK